MSAEAGRSAFSAHFGKRPVRLFGSGTQALAAAIMDATSRKGLEPAKAEVILPAYGCPDLISACMFANVLPRLVDTTPDAWGYDRDQLRVAVGPATAAVVAVNLLGVGDEAASVIAEVRSAGIPVIQDSAQFISIRNDVDWPGDYVVVSFGRGKPINLMGGGALIGGLSMEKSLHGRSSLAGSLQRRLQHSLLAGVTFNTITHPSVYGFAAKLPGLGVGATVFHPLQQIESWDDDRMWRRVGAGLAAYLQDRYIGSEAWEGALTDLGRYGVTSLQAQCSDRLLRFPLLVPPEQRDRLVEALTAQGATAMYRGILPQIDSVPAFVSEQGPFPNALRLAKRLVTLPTHRFVTKVDVERVLDVVRTSQRG